MARHYTSKDFFRQMPKTLLARYFQARGVFGELDFTALPEGKPEALFDAWLALPDMQRNEMDAEFREIFDMSNERGFVAIVDEARWRFATDAATLTQFVDKLAALHNHYERAMITFLEYKECWKGATRFNHADRLSHWRKRGNLPKVAAAVDEDSLKKLAALISRYFHLTEGRGKNCVVEPFRRGERDYFFAYPEDHSQRSIEWVDGEFHPRPHNPAFEVVFVYSQADGSLDLNFRGNYRAVEPLQAMFADAILKQDELPPDPKDGRVYDLNPLQQKEFQFTSEVGSGIAGVVVKKLRLSSEMKKGDRVTLEANTSDDPDAVYKLFDKLRPALQKYNVTQVELAATVTVDEDKPPKVVTFRITHPNSCSLKYDELDLKLRAMLAASGIEPKKADGVVPGDDT